MTYPLELRLRAVEFLSMGFSHRPVARVLGVSPSCVRKWELEMRSEGAASLGTCHNGRVPPSGGGAVDDLGELRAEAAALRAELASLRGERDALALEIDVMRVTRELLKKGPGTDPKRLTNREKALAIGELRASWPLSRLLAALSIAKSSYEYQRAALARPAPDDSALDAAVAASHAGSAGAYGYRRVAADLRRSGVAASERSVRRSMRRQGLEGRAPRRRRYSSYAGEPAGQGPPNLPLVDARRDLHRFQAGAPNELWVTDVTEFLVPAGRLYLSVVVDCFDGLPVGWSTSTSPDHLLTESSLEMACGRLSGERPVVHSDRGRHYFWPGWVAICRRHGLARSMSRKGHSPDNAACEGFFGRLKVELFHGRDWSGWSLADFAGAVGDYMRWYAEERVKLGFGCSILERRRALGIEA